MGGITVLLGIQMTLALTGFYTTNTMSTPPRLVLIALPTIVLFLSTFLTKTGQSFVDSLPLLPITYLNIIRIPVEFCLYWLFLNKAVPELMTFAGLNFDIIAGITAPFIAYFGFQKQQIAKKWLLLWNILMLGLLLNIIFHALLSTPTILQQMAFEQPNIAITHFPFIWLPVFVVPMVFFGHLVSIQQLRKVV